MSKKIFTTEEVKALAENSYVKSATRKSVTMVPEFKKLAYDEMLKGKTIRQVFEAIGIKPEIIGETRMKGYSDRIWKEADCEGGFEDGRKTNYRHDAESETAVMKKKIAQLEHQVVYLQQENAFLKKIRQAEEEYGGKAGRQN